MLHLDAIDMLRTLVFVLYAQAFCLYDESLEQHGSSTIALYRTYTALVLAF